MSRVHARGYLALLIGVTLFSTVEIAGKIIGGRVDPFVLTFIRFFTTGLILIPLSQAWSKVPVLELGWRDLGIFCLNGLVGVSLGISLFHYAILAFDKAASSAVVFSVNPVFITILARFINNEPWTARKWGAVALGAGGVSFFAMESGRVTSRSLAGLLLMLLSACLFGLSICIARRFVQRYGAMRFMGMSALMGSLMLLPIAAVRVHAAGVDGILEAWGSVLYISLVGTAAAYFFYYWGLSHTSAHSGAMAFFLKPVLASALAVGILHEHLNLYMMAGTSLIVAGLGLSVRLRVKGACILRSG